MISRRRFIRMGAATAALTAIPRRLWPRPADLDTVCVIHTTDLHGNILPTSAYDGTPNVGGLARCATRIREWQRRFPHHLLIDAGDLYQGTEPGYRTRGAVMIDCLNHLGYDAWILGNHEFDWGMEAVHGAIDRSGMPVLAANTEFDGVEVWRGRGQSRVRPWIVKEVGGYKVAFIGLTTPAMSSWFLPELIPGFAAQDPVPVLRRMIDEVKSHRPDTILLGCHMGIRPGMSADDSPNRLFGMTEACPEIDVIIAGHTHRDFPNHRINGIPYTQADYFGIHVGRLDLVFERNSRKLLAVEPATATMDASVSLDPEILALAAPHTEEAERHLDERVGFLADELGIENSPGQPSDLERLIGMAILSGMNRREYGVDACIHGQFFAGAPVPPGPKRVRDLWTLVPFENFVVTAELSPYELAASMEEIYRQRTIRGLHGLRPVIEGRGDSLRVTGITDAAGNPLDGRRRYRVAMNSYDAASGGGRFRVLREILGRSSARMKLHPFQTRALLIEYFRDQSPVRKRDQSG